MNTKETPGLITLTEERLSNALRHAFIIGSEWRTEPDNQYSDAVMEPSNAHASRIIEGLKKEG